VDGIAEGERVVVESKVERGHVTFTSMIPGDCCEAGGLSWKNTVDAIDGSRPDYIPFDYNRDGSIDQDDLLEVDGEQVIGTGIQVETGLYSPSSSLKGVGDFYSISDGGIGKNPSGTDPSSARTWLQLE